MFLAMKLSANGTWYSENINDKISCLQPSTIFWVTCKQTMLMSLKEMHGLLILSLSRTHISLLNGIILFNLCEFNVRRLNAKRQTPENKIALFLAKRSNRITQWGQMHIFLVSTSVQHLYILLLLLKLPKAESSTEKSYFCSGWLKETLS